MTTNLKAVVRYDGAAFAGWQVQPHARTVQGEIQSALSRIAGQEIRVHGASRTDAGVHALGQVMSFRWPDEYACDRLTRSLCGMLKPHIRIEAIEPVPEDFHARKSARGKCYAYCLQHARYADPFLGRYGWAVPWELDLALLRDSARLLEGHHDFAGFQCEGSPCHCTTRTLHAVELREGAVIGPCDASSVYHLALHGDGFLYKMVRNIVGTLVDIARGKLPPDRIPEMLASPGPFHGHTAPPNGLTLIEVLY